MWANPSFGADVKRVKAESAQDASGSGGSCFRTAHPLGPAGVQRGRSQAVEKPHCGLPRIADEHHVATRVERCTAACRAPVEGVDFKILSQVAGTAQTGRRRLVAAAASASAPERA